MLWCCRCLPPSPSPLHNNGILPPFFSQSAWWVCAFFWATQWGGRQSGANICHFPPLPSIPHIPRASDNTKTILVNKGNFYFQSFYLRDWFQANRLPCLMDIPRVFSSFSSSQTPPLPPFSRSDAASSFWMDTSAFFRGNGGEEILNCLHFHFLEAAASFGL